MKFKLIMTLVNPEITENLIDVARKAGATGYVTLSARGTGVQETRFLGMQVEDKTNMVLFVVEEHMVSRIVESITTGCKLREPGRGIAIVLGVEQVAGLETQIDRIKDNLKNEQL
jgi:nitrogen regulatory protein P-II 1